MRIRFLGLLTFYFAFLIIATCKAGGGGAGAKTAEEAEKDQQYWLAIEKYTKVYGKTKDRAKKADIAFHVAEMCLENKLPDRAIGWYMKARAMGNNSPTVTLHLADAYKQACDYQHAAEEYRNYLREYPGDKKVEEMIAFLDQIKVWIDSPRTRFVVQDFKIANSGQNDFSPMLYKKEGLYFTTDREGVTIKGKVKYGRTGKNFSDIFVLKRVARTAKGKKENAATTYTWQVPPVKASGDINTIMNDGTPAFDSKGNAMFYTQCNGEKLDSIQNCRVMMATKKGNDWTLPTALDFCNDTTVNYGQPTISPDGNRIVFSANIPGGKGKQDLWMVTKVKRAGTWSDPINLGDRINTEGNELFPFFFNDTTLYFASDGHIGMGGLDMFQVRGTNPDWSKPENLKYPMNSCGDDFGITFEDDGVSGFFTSNRTNPEALGNDDIYQFYREPLVFYIAGKVVSCDGRPLEKAKVSISNQFDNTTIDVLTNDTGGYFIKLPPNGDFAMRATMKSYFPSTEIVRTIKGLEYTTTLRQNFEICTDATTIKLGGVYYDLNSAKLRPESEKTLDSFITVLNEMPNVTVELGSHTDCRATYAYNDSLSLARSKSVVDYFISKGIDADRLEAKGYGESKLLNDCACEEGKGPGMECTEAQHQANRRTEATVLRRDYTNKRMQDEEKKKLDDAKKSKKKKKGTDNGEGK